MTVRRRPHPVHFARALVAAALVLGLVLPAALDRHAAVEGSDGVKPLRGVVVEIAAVHRGAPAHAEAATETRVERCVACRLLAQAGAGQIAPAPLVAAPEVAAAAAAAAVAVPLGRTALAPSGRAPPLV
jgi:hypothetical protein